MSRNPFYIVGCLVVLALTVTTDSKSQSLSTSNNQIVAQQPHRLRLSFLPIEGTRGLPDGQTFIVRVISNIKGL